MLFEDLTITQLKDIVKKYQLHYKIKGYSKMKKDKLIENMKMHLHIDGDIIKHKGDNFETKAPYTSKQKSDFTKAYKEIMKMPSSMKDLIPKETIDFYKANKKKDRKLTKKQLDEIEKMKKLFEKGSKGDITTEDLDMFKKEKKEKKGKTIKVKGKKSEDKVMKNIESRVEKQLEGKSDEDILKMLQSLVSESEANLKANEKKLKGSGFLDGLKSALEVADQSGKAGDIAGSLGMNSLSNILSGIQSGVDLVKSTGAVLHNTAEQYAPGASQNPILKQNFGWLGFGSPHTDYGLHAVLIKSDMPMAEALKMAKEISGKRKLFHRQTKMHHRFRNIPKTKFEKKSFRSKKINDNITLVFGKLKPEFKHLEGGGVFDWLKKGYEKVKSVFNKNDKFNNTSNKTLEKYGNKKIVELSVIRTPINSLIKKVLKGLGGNLKYDELFHLGLIAEVEGGKKIILEKNETINIDDKFKSSRESQYMKVPYNRNITLNDLVNNSMKLWIPGYKFYEYNYKDNNCQIFVSRLLKGSDLLTDDLQKFIMQDVSDLLGNKAGKVANFVTDVAGVVNKITGGAIEGDKIIMNKADYIREHEKLIKMLKDIAGMCSREAMEQENEPDYKALKSGARDTIKSLAPEDIVPNVVPGRVPQIAKASSQRGKTTYHLTRTGDDKVTTNQKGEIIESTTLNPLRKKSMTEATSTIKPEEVAEFGMNKKPDVINKKGLLNKVKESIRRMTPKKGIEKQKGKRQLLSSIGEGSGMSDVRLIGGKGNVSLIKEIRSGLVKHLKKVLKIYMSDPEYKANYPQGWNDLDRMKQYVDSVFFGAFDRNQINNYITQIENLGKRSIINKVRKVRNEADLLRDERKKLITLRAIISFENAIQRITESRLWNPKGLEGEPNIMLGDQLLDIMKELIRKSENYPSYLELSARQLNELEERRNERDREIARLQEEMGELEDRMDTLSSDEYVKQANALRDRYRELTSGRAGGGIKNLPKVKKGRGKKEVEKYF